jgi:hypothetical protein
MRSKEIKTRVIMMAKYLSILELLKMTFNSCTFRLLATHKDAGPRFTGPSGRWMPFAFLHQLTSPVRAVGWHFKSAS